MKKLYLIHHSHTDIGYTERQEKLMRYHRDFILQAIQMLDEIHEGKRPECRGFKWQCENHWQVENFYSTSTDEERKKFQHYVHTGEIGLSGNYLNMTELVDENVLRSRTEKVRDYANRTGIQIRCGMSADINGYAWGYPDILSDCGVENLYCALHSHHGMFPLSKNQQPFFWEGPKGGKILVWVGDHYHMGNELFLCPQGGTSYGIHDDIRDEVTGKGSLVNSSEYETAEKEIRYALIRLRRYTAQLEKENYPFDCFPMMVSGAITDNAPPNIRIAERISRLNELLRGELEIQMATIDDFFTAIRESGITIPTYQGDFTDWWADGVGSTPNTLKLYREAQRKLDLCSSLDPETVTGSAELIEQAQENMMLYAEHTWGYSSSVSEPWDSLVACLEKKKDEYAIRANTLISRNLDQVLASHGEVSISAEGGQHYKVINPHDMHYRGTVRLYLEHWEYLSGSLRSDTAELHIVDEDTGEEYPCHGRAIARAFEAELVLTLKPHEERRLHLYQSFEKAKTIMHAARAGAENVSDILLESQQIETPFEVETDSLHVFFSKEKGIAEIYDKTMQKVITDPSCEGGVFSAIYERTAPGLLSQCEVRRRMGRNRSALGTDRTWTKVENIEIVETGPVSVTVKLTYQTIGAHFYLVFLKIFRSLPMIEAKICMHKKSIWDPENYYVALPFLISETEETYVDKTGCILRPGIDQLPGTCQNFYLIQNGIGKFADGKGLIIASKDAPLVAFGKREAAPIQLCDGKNWKLNRSIPYSWIMNNFWETNFKADLGGFYEFTYTVCTGTFRTPEEGLKYAKVLNEGVLGFRTRGN